MPRVPAYEAGQVQERPILQQGITTRATAEAFGSTVGRGVAQIAQGVSMFGDALQQVEDAKALADAKGADDQLASWNRERQYGEGGYMITSGKAAIDGQKQYGIDLEAKRREISGGLSPAARLKFDPASRTRINSSLDQAIVHSANETKRYVSEASAARLNTFQEDALAGYQNDALVTKNIAAGQSELRQQAELEGWGTDKLQNAEKEYISGVRKSVALRVAQSDPEAAKSYAERYKNQLTGPAQADLEGVFAPLMVDEDAKREAGKFMDEVSSGSERTRQFAATDLPSVAYGLLGAIKGPESAGRYNVRFAGGGRGETFDGYGDHPRVREAIPAGFKGAGKTSDAAGAYQYLSSTWDRVSGALGLPDFSPANQDRGAWWLAQADYKRNTGRDLTSDLDAGRYGDVRRGLSSTWEGLGRMSDAKFAAAIQSGSSVSFGAGGVAAADPTAYLDGISNPAVRQATAQRISTMLAIQKRQQEAQMLAMKTQAFGIIDAGQSPDAIPAEVRAALGREEVSGLWSYYEGRSKRGEPETDDQTLYDLQTMYAQDPESFRQIDLFKYRDRLDDAAWKEVTGWRQTALTDQRKAKDDGAAVTAAFSQASTQLEAVGITTVDKKGADREEAARRLAQFQNMLASQMREFQEEKGSKPTQQDVQAMINRLLLPVVVSQEKSTWNPTKTPWSSSYDVSKPFFEVGKIGDVSRGQSARVLMKYDRIPPGDRLDVEIALERQLGRKPSQEEVEAKYAQFLSSAYSLDE